MDMSRSDLSSRGRTWFELLTSSTGNLKDGPRTVLAADAHLGRDVARFLAVVPDPANRFPRARHGEVGLDEGWALAREIRDTKQTDGGEPTRPIIAIVENTKQTNNQQKEKQKNQHTKTATADAYA